MFLTLLRLRVGRWSLADNMGVQWQLADNTYLTERSVRSVRADDLAEIDEDINEAAAMKTTAGAESPEELRDEGPLASSASSGD